MARRFYRFALSFYLVVFFVSFVPGSVLLAADVQKTDIQKTDAQAKEPRSLVIGSYNIHICRGNDGRLDFDRIAKVLEVKGLDFVGLQEVDNKTRRTQKTDQFAELRKRTKMTGRFGKSINYKGGEYGIAFLTSGQVLEYRHRKFPPLGKREPRSFQLVKIRAKNGLEFWVLNTHLGLKAAERKHQIQAILDEVKDLAGPVILLGDFNAMPDGDLYARLSKKYTEKPATQADVSLVRPKAKERFVPHHGETFSSAEPNRQIDYIWLRQGTGLKIDRSWIRRTEASDHLPLFSRLTE